MLQCRYMPYADKERQREYQRRWAAERRAAFFRGKRCVRCGGAKRLELDHIDPSKKVSHNIWSWSEPKREAEIAKCQVLCRPCHEQKTARDMRYGLTHGTEHGYRRYRCRCAHCKAAHSREMAKYRRRMRAKIEQTDFKKAA